MVAPCRDRGSFLMSTTDARRESLKYQFDVRRVLLGYLYSTAIPSACDARQA